MSALTQQHPSFKEDLTHEKINRPVSDLLLVLTMTAALAETDITLWTFPIGDWGNSEKVDEMLAAFNASAPRHQGDR